MSLIPFILDLAEELHEIKCSVGLGNASGIDTDDFGFGVFPHELQLHSQPHHHHHHHQLRQANNQELRRSRPLSQLYWLPKQRHHPYNRSNRSKSGAQPTAPVEADREGGEAHGGKAAYSSMNRHGFQVSMNVKQFAANELTVKTIDNCIVVEGRHEEKEDGHGVISRHFIRKYMLPRAYDPSDVLSTLSSDGILTVKAPLPPAIKADSAVERSITIQQIGPGLVQHLATREAAAREAAAREHAKAPSAAAAAAAKEQQQPILQKMQKEQTPQHPPTKEQQESQKVSKPKGDGVATVIRTDAEPKPKKPQTEIETKPAKSGERAEPAAGGETSSVAAGSSAPPIAIDVVMDAGSTDGGNGAAAAAAEKKEEEEEKEQADMDLDMEIEAAVGASADGSAEVGACTNNDKKMEKENGRVSEGALPVVIPVVVIGDMEKIEAAADATATAMDVDGNRADAAAIVASTETEKDDANAKDAVVENLIAVAQLPTSGDLVAAADAAILFAKGGQCENGTAAKSSAEEVN